MTIGMLLESMTSKAFSLKGRKSTFSSYERVDFKDVGKILEKEGFYKLGNEMLYSGVYGVPLKA